MKVDDLVPNVINFAKQFGMNPKQANGTDGNAIIRDNTIADDAYKNGKAYFGFISPEEEFTSQYYDLSFVIFPQKESGAFIVALGVGTQGWKNDYALAQLPGLRRAFLRLMTKDGKSFCKTSFTDIDSPCKLPENPAYKTLSEPLNRDKYGKVILAYTILNLDDDNSHKIEDEKLLKAWLATYAYYRDWPRTQETVKAVMDAINAGIPERNVDELSEIRHLLQQRHFVVLQGAPGTGKTFNAMRIAKNENAGDNDLKFEKEYFTQFHAETTYADFVYGIRPVLVNKSEFQKTNSDKSDSQKPDSKDLGYEGKKGILLEAIETAENTQGNVLLIIDEINRANLANVLGPVFYLFEYQTGDRPTTIKIGSIAKVNARLEQVNAHRTGKRAFSLPNPCV